MELKLTKGEAQVLEILRKYERSYVHRYILTRVFDDASYLHYWRCSSEIQSLKDKKLLRKEPGRRNIYVLSDAGKQIPIPKDLLEGDEIIL